MVVRASQYDDCTPVVGVCREEDYDLGVTFLFNEVSWERSAFEINMVVGCDLIVRKFLYFKEGAMHQLIK